MAGKLFYTLFTAALAATSVAAPAPGNSHYTVKSSNNLVPKTTVLDGHKLYSAKVALSRREPSTVKARNTLVGKADKWLKSGPWTVTSKKATPPGGTKHDYTSQSPYFWSVNGNGACPYEFRDGQRNPAVDQWTDYGESTKMFEATYTLSLAWYYTGNQAYAKHASRIIRAWFLDKKTRMTPNMRYAQMIPCMNVDENPYAFSGLIDFSQRYSSILDSVDILSSTKAPGWSKKDQREFEDWNRQFLEWLNSSKTGKNALKADNNHGSFAAMMSASIGLFVGNKTIARELLEGTKGRIDSHFLANGTQPHEMSRTRPWHYSNFNLVSFTRLALLGDKVGIDLWGYKGSKGQNIMKGIEFLLPAAVGGKSAWPYPDIGFHQYAAYDNVHAAAQKGNKLAKKAVSSGKLEPPPGGALWVLRPAPEQLDAITE